MTEIKNGCEAYGCYANLGIEIEYNTVRIYVDENVVAEKISLAALETALQKEKTKFIQETFEIK